MTRRKALAIANDIIQRFGLDPHDGDTAAEIAEALIDAYRTGEAAGVQRSRAARKRVA